MLDHGNHHQSHAPAAQRAARPPSAQTTRPAPQTPLPPAQFPWSVDDAPSAEETASTANDLPYPGDQPIE